MDFDLSILIIANNTRIIYDIYIYIHVRINPNIYKWCNPLEDGGMSFSEIVLFFVSVSFLSNYWADDVDDSDLNWYHWFSCLLDGWTTHQILEEKYDTSIPSQDLVLVIPSFLHSWGDWVNSEKYDTSIPSMSPWTPSPRKFAAAAELYCLGLQHPDLDLLVRHRGQNMGENGYAPKKAFEWNKNHEHDDSHDSHWILAWPTFRQTQTGLTKKHIERVWGKV